MEIKTKYNINDKVYKIKNNYKLELCTIKLIIPVVDETNIDIRYETDKDPAPIYESMLFKDLDDIINHFKNKIEVLEKIINRL